VSGQHRFELPDGTAREEERVILLALERYLRRENPHPHPWVLAGRVEATGYGALQARKYADAAWGIAGRAPFARPGVPPQLGRGDAS
jgi:hypothetical protein